MKQKLLLLLTLLVTSVTGAWAAGDVTASDDATAVTNGAVCKIGTEYYSTLQAAVTDAEGKDETTITMIADCETDYVLLESGHNIILDLNGCTIKGKNAATGVTSKTSATKSCVICNDYGKLVINDSKGTGNIYNATATNNSGYRTIVNYATLTINGGNFGSNAADAASGCALYNSWGGTATINGGTFTIGTADCSSDNEQNYNAGYTIQNTYGTSGNYIIPSTIIVNNATLKGSLRGAFANSCGYLTINDVNVDGRIYYYIVSDYYGETTINGGTFTQKVNTGHETGTVFYVNGGTIDVLGGKFSHDEESYSKYNVKYTIASDGTTNQNILKGGIYDCDPTDYVADGYIKISNPDETTKATYPYKVVKAVAQITTDDTTVKYATIADAIADVPEDGTATTITMIANCETRSVTIPTTKNITLDLNGKTVVGKEDDIICPATEGYYFRPVIYNLGTFVITDNTEAKEGKMYSAGSISITYDEDKNFPSNWITVLNKGTLTVENGWLGDSQKGSCGNNIYNYGTATINGGHFTRGPVEDADMSVWRHSGYTFVNKYSAATMTINGGYIYGNHRGPINNSGTLVVNDLNVDARIYYYLVYNADGSATINGGTYTQNAETGSEKGIVFYVAGGTVEVNGGKYSHDESSFSKHSVTYTIASNGTTKQNILKGGIYDADPTKYVADGYASADNPDETTKATYPWTVIAATTKQQTEKSLEYVEPTDEAAKTAIDKTISTDNTNVSTFDNEVKSCVNTTAQETIGSAKNYVSVKLKAAITSTTKYIPSEGSTVVTEMKFNVKPVYITISEGVETETEIPNSVIEKGITFRLPVDNNVTAATAKVYHYSTSLGYYNILGDASDGGKYIEITSKDFSEFSYLLEDGTLAGTVYAGTSAGTTGQTLDDFNTTRATYPNAVMIIDSEYANLVPADQENVIVKYAAGKKGLFYECPKFVLTDRDASATSVDFYSPVDFTAVSGSYSREFTANISSCTLPFALTSSEVGADIMTFAYYEPIYESGVKTEYAYAYFRTQTAVDAATPVFIKGTASFTKAFTNTPIVVTPDNSNMAGTFAATEKFQQEGYWGLNSNSDKLVPATTGTLGAFRSLVNMTEDMSFSDHSSDARASVIYIGIIGEDGTTTGIDETPTAVVNPTTDNGSIYNINGAKVSNTNNAGVYIINGKKVIK